MSSGPFDALFQSYLDLRWHFDPVDATRHGVTGHDHRLGAFDAESVARHVAALRAIEAALEEADLSDVDDEIDRTATLNEIRTTVHVLQHEDPWRRNPVRWLEHMLDGLLLGSADPAGAVHPAAVERLEAVPAYLADAQQALEQCPVLFVEAALSMLEGAVEFLDGLAAHIEPSHAAAADAARAACLGFGAHLRDRPDEPADGAVGRDAFEYRLRFQHALRTTAATLWSYGVDLIKRFDRDLTTLTSEMGHAGPWRDLADRLRADAPADADVVPMYRDAAEQARVFVCERRLATVPGDPIEVVPTPPFLRPVVPVTAYRPAGGFSSSRRGTLYVTAPEGTPSRHCAHAIPGTVVHEAYPGHHLHFQRAADQPRVARRVLSTPVTVEGWATYGEEMMAEAGYHATAEERFFQRVAALLHAVRIVVDVGFHTEGMTVDGARETMMNVAGLDREAAEAEVRRCGADPTTQLSYAVGRREFLTLRERFRAVRGPHDATGPFHDRVLDYGGLPPSLIAWGLGLG